jgi:hypothetical protein
VNGAKAAPCGAAAWHPGPAAHALRASVLAHAYASAMDAALRLAIAHVSSQQGGAFRAGPDAAVASARVLRAQVGGPTPQKKAPCAAQNGLAFGLCVCVFAVILGLNGFYALCGTFPFCRLSGGC